MVEHNSLTLLQTKERSEKNAARWKIIALLSVAAIVVVAVFATTFSLRNGVKFSQLQSTTARQLQTTSEQLQSATDQLQQANDEIGQLRRQFATAERKRDEAERMFREAERKFREAIPPRLEQLEKDVEENARFRKTLNEMRSVIDSQTTRLIRMRNALRDGGNALRLHVYGGSDQVIEDMHLRNLDQLEEAIKALRERPSSSPRNLDQLEEEVKKNNRLRSTYQNLIRDLHVNQNRLLHTMEDFSPDP